MHCCSSGRSTTVVLAACKLAKKRSAADKAAASLFDCGATSAFGVLWLFRQRASWPAVLACLLAHACLRFSDAQRSENIQLGKSSLFGFCWRSKRQRTGFPFAALRAAIAQTLGLTHCATCGWKFGSKSHTPKTFLVDKPSGPEFVDCGACSAPSVFFSFLSDAGNMPTGSTVPGGRRRLRRSQPSAPLL